MKRLRMILLAWVVALTGAVVGQRSVRAVDFYDEPGVRLLNQPVSEYRARRQALMNEVKDGVVVLLGNVEENQGIEERYRQNNWMAYLTGVRTPNAAVMLIPTGLPSEKGARELIFIPPRNLFEERWTGVQIGPGEEAARAFGVERVLPIKDNGEASAQSRAAAMPGQAASDPLANLFQKLKEAAQRMKPGMYEYEVQAIIEAAFTRNGAERPGFPSIIGSGLYSTILHYSENHKRIEEGDLVVCDIGAEYSLYTADITRTYPANGKFTARQRAVYQLVFDTQAAAARHWKPGMTMRELQAFAQDFMRQSPLRARDADGREYTMDHFFIHGLGHYLGMDVHDVGDYRKPLGANQVFTIEPGIYIQTEKLGVRIEDDYVIVPDNTIRKLSAAIPSAPDDIERLMAAKIAAR